MNTKPKQTKTILSEILTELKTPVIQIEEPLTQNQANILSLLREQTKPMLARTISARLMLNYNTTRARLSELLHMGFITQPNKNKTQVRNSIRLCGYSILTK
jgi:hypothetical protein